jgi:molecular chaperone GrpE
MSDDPKDPKADEERPDGMEPPEDGSDEDEDFGDEDLGSSAHDSDSDSDSDDRDDSDDDQPAAEGEAGEPDIEVLGYEALTDAGVSLGGPDEEEAGEEHDIDLSEFDGPVEDRSSLESELDAARDQTDELRREKVELESQVAALRDQLKRTAADFENYRKRVERDRKEERKQAASGLVLELLAVTDNFRRALEQAESAAAENEVLAGFVEGVSLIETQFFDILRGAGLEPVSADGDFDPAVHEALMQEPTTEAPHLSVLEVFEPGYLFGGRLLRPARVKVALNPGGASEAEAGGGQPEGAPEAPEQGDGGAGDGDSPQDSE